MRWKLILVCSGPHARCFTNIDFICILPFCEIGGIKSCFVKRKKKKKRGSERLSNVPKVPQHWDLFQVYLAPESKFSFYS